MTDETTQDFDRLRSIHVKVVSSTRFVQRPVVAKTVGQKFKRLMGEYIGTTCHHVAGKNWHRLYVNGQSVGWINQGMVLQVDSIQKALAEGSKIEIRVTTKGSYSQGPSSYTSNSKQKFVEEIEVRKTQ